MYISCSYHKRVILILRSVFLLKIYYDNRDVCIYHTALARTMCITFLCTCICPYLHTEGFLSIKR